MQKTIGIFDSGVGGLSIWKAIYRNLPMLNTIYLGDGINAPYGEKSKEIILALSIRNTEWLLEQGAEAIVVACNTATTNAINELRKNYQIPFIGIEPATKPAALNTITGKIGILATKGTFASELFLNTSSAYRGKVEIIETIGSGLVPLIENGNLTATKPLLERYLQPMVDQGIDNLVLGCTHYPFLIDMIRQIIPREIKIVEPSEAIANRVMQILSPQTTELQGKHEFYTTAEPETMNHFIELSGLNQPDAQHLKFKA